MLGAFMQKLDEVHVIKGPINQFADELGIEDKIAFRRALIKLAKINGGKVGFKLDARELLTIAEAMNAILYESSPERFIKLRTFILRFSQQNKDLNNQENKE